MQPSELLALAEQLIPVYRSPDLDYVLDQIAYGHSSTTKLLIKMELKRIMSPCSRTVDLRGRVQGECREYQLDGRKHHLDDVAFNVYHKGIKKFGGYTEGVWELLNNTHNNFRVMKQNNQINNQDVSLNNQFELEPITLGFDLRRQERRLRIASQVKIVRQEKKQLVHGLSVDLSPSGARFKVPSAFDYQPNEIILVSFIELAKNSTLSSLEQPFEYRVLAVDESHENDAVKFLRTIRLTPSHAIEQAIDEALQQNDQKIKQDHQDIILRTRTRGYEHHYLKHTSHLPLFFSGTQLKLALMTENNHEIWHYWQDERNLQTLEHLFNPTRMNAFLAPEQQNEGQTLYSFTHDHQGKTLFFSLLAQEASADQQQLFYYVGSRRDSWRVFRFTLFSLTAEEREILASHGKELANYADALTHYGVLREVANTDNAADYQIYAKPNLAASELNQFRHSRKVQRPPLAVFYDARTRRREPRYSFQTPIKLHNGSQILAEGTSLDISKHGLSVRLTMPLQLKAQDKLYVNFQELKQYDDRLPLNAMPYTLVRINTEGDRLQLQLEENSQTMRAIGFFNSIIENNQDYLQRQEERLPSPILLESLHNVLLDKTVSAPIFVEKSSANLKPKVIGVSYPLHPALVLLAKLSKKGSIALDPIFKGHTNTLLATPMRRIDGAQPISHDVYLAAFKYGSRLQSVESKLLSEFDSIQERIRFIQRAQEMGEIYILRFTAVPVFNAFTQLMRQDLNELAQVSMSQAQTLEKEFAALAGFGELIDITKEVLSRLKITSSS